MTPFDPILHFLLQVTAVSLHAKFDVFGFNHLRDIRGGPKIPKLGHVTQTWPLLTQLCIFSLELTAVRLRVKFEVSRFNGS